MKNHEERMKYLTELEDKLSTTKNIDELEEILNSLKIEVESDPSLSMHLKLAEFAINMAKQAKLESGKSKN